MTRAQRINLGAAFEQINAYVTRMEDALRGFVEWSERRTVVKDSELFLLVEQAKTALDEAGPPTLKRET
jgi:hypothetical protein